MVICFQMKASETAYSDDCEILDLITSVDSESSLRQCNPKIIQPNISDEDYNDGVPIYKPIRVRENFIRPKTPPGMKDFILRIQEREKLNKEPTLLCEETILEDSKENITNEPQTHSVKEAFHEIPEKPTALVDSMITSTQNAVNQSTTAVEFHRSLSPIPRKSQKLDTLDTSSILDDSMAEIIIPSTNVEQTNSHRFRLINPETYSQNDVLIIPRVQQSSTLTGNCESNNNNNSKGQKLKRQSIELTQKLSISAPLTPDLLVNFVSRMRKPKSFSAKKKQKEETMKRNDNNNNNNGNNTNNTNVTQRKDEIRKSPNLFITPNKKSSNLHTTGTPKTPRKAFAIDNKSLSEPRLKSTPDKRNKTPKQLPTKRLTNRTPCNSKSVGKVKVKKTPAKEKNPRLPSSSGDHKDTHDLNKLPCGEIKSNRKLYTPSNPRPVCPRLPVDLDETMSPVVLLMKSDDNQNMKSVQTSSLAPSPIRKRLRSSMAALSPTQQPSSSDWKQRIRTDQVTTPICRKSKRISLSHIKPISNRNSLEEFRLTPVEKCKSDVTMKSPSTSVNTPTKISIVFSGTQSEDEQVLTALLKSSNLKNYVIVKLPSNSIAANSDSRRSNTVRPGTASRACATPHFTHLITQVPCRRTLKLFYALIQGVHICTTDWIRESVASNMWLSESLFKPLGLPRLSRLQRMNTLFSNTGVIYVGSDTNPPRQDLVDLLSLGGAVLTNKKMEASVLIGCNVPNKMCVKVNWILDCIYQAKLLSMLEYKL
uniref:BRCT domain-containing protein n=1 Tax=Trichobilharzia regenti TaxID=157069 RepID=A0AA85KFS3_TRIRE|nr:unnamed protein product [Trichobilharzia regenti]